MTSEGMFAEFADFRSRPLQSAQNNASYVVEDGQSQKQAMRKLYIIYSYEEY